MKGRTHPSARQRHRPSRQTVAAPPRTGVRGSSIGSPLSAKTRRAGTNMVIVDRTDRFLWQPAPRDAPPHQEQGTKWSVLRETAPSSGSRNLSKPPRPHAHPTRQQDEEPSGSPLE